MSCRIYLPGMTCSSCGRKAGVMDNRSYSSGPYYWDVRQWICRHETAYTCPECKAAGRGVTACRTCGQDGELT